MIQRIDGRLQHEINGVERICNLFELAINEGHIVRYEIILVDDHFYLNPENILRPNSSPSQPFPLLEPEGLYVSSIDHLKMISDLLSEVCPYRRISLVAFSSLLTNYAEHVPVIE